MKTVAQGILRKMKARLQQPVAYAMSLDRQLHPLNPLLGRRLRLEFSGVIRCKECGRDTKKSYDQGHCYPCFRDLAQCDTCITRPEQCHFARGTCRQPAWGERHCMRDHIVYLANASGLKVGITRATQVPVRWIDQGATQALALIRVRSRLQSGELEVMFKGHVADKTNWRDMLKGEAEPLSLADEAARLLAKCKDDIAELEARLGFFAISVLRGVEPVHIQYPVQDYPQEIKALSLDKEPVVEGVLTGIKGQYLMFDCGVLNLRRHAGYEVSLMY